MTDTTYAPGMILAYDCGYSMSLPHFARVESVTPSGKSVRIRELASDFESFDPPYNTFGHKTPSNRAVGELMTCRITQSGYVKVGIHFARRAGSIRSPRFSAKAQAGVIHDCMD